MKGALNDSIGLRLQLQRLGAEPEDVGAAPDPATKEVLLGPLNPGDAN